MTAAMPKQAPVKPVVYMGVQTTRIYSDPKEKINYYTCRPILCVCG